MKKRAGSVAMPAHFLSLRLREGMEGRKGLHQRRLIQWFVVAISKKVALHCPKYFFDHFNFHNRTPLSLRFSASQFVGQIHFRSLKRILDHSRDRFTANLKLALRAQTLNLRQFRFTKNGYQKFFNVRSRGFGQQPLEISVLFFLPTE